MGQALDEVEDGQEGWECLRCCEPVRSCERVTGVMKEEEGGSRRGSVYDEEDAGYYSSGT